MQVVAPESPRDNLSYHHPFKTLPHSQKPEWVHFKAFTTPDPFAASLWPHTWFLYCITEYVCVCVSFWLWNIIWLISIRWKRSLDLHVGWRRNTLMVICMCQNKIQWNRVCYVPLRQNSALKKNKIIIMTCQIVWNENMFLWNWIFIKIFNLKDTFPTKSYIRNQSCWGPAFYVSISG